MVGSEILSSIRGRRVEEPAGVEASQELPRCPLATTKSAKTLKTGFVVLFSRYLRPLIVCSFSGAEDVVLVEYAKQAGVPFRVFSLDTGRLHPETYQLFQVWSLQLL